ncbi:PKD domain-containing protein [Aestuariivivens insulae]|uniref:PKD domain-containing protein n=1 Tax=Aestuariivivens insulae TaxID=1621988 RepID=UPI001F57C7BA|nr:PKD domain-containing protein [Aestuariivivens insulae]
MKKQLFLSVSFVLLIAALLLWQKPLSTFGASHARIGEGVQHPHYLDMMEDLSCNVYDVIAAGEAYFKDKDKGKGTGYKQFRRWVMLNEDQFYPSGDRTRYNPFLPFEIRGQYGLENVTPASRPTFEGATTATMVANSWGEMGPNVELKMLYNNTRNGNGRVDAIWVNPSDENHIYIGCRGGGFWKTTDGGLNWTPKTDQLGITGVRSIAVNPSNVNEVYISTNIGSLSTFYSMGIFKSTNGGDTWSATGYTLDIVTDLTKVHKVIIDPSNPQILFAATSNGLIRTVDGFQTYSTVLTGQINDVEFKPGDSNTVYASNDTDKTLYKSTNGGASFTSTGLTTPAKMQIAITPAAPNNVYVSAKNYFTKSTNSGTSFTQGGSPDGGTGQYGGFGVSDTDANLIINGSLDTYRSTNGGTSFTKVTNWVYGNSTGIGGNFVHADNRQVVVVNGNIYMGTDGWLVKSVDGGLNYSVLTFNMGNHEIYEHGLGVSQADDNTLVVGTQDNGTSILYDGVWRHWRGGDGGTSVADYSNINVFYCSLYNGDFKRTDNAAATGIGTDLGDTKPGTLPPLVQHPTDPNTLFLGEGSGQVWKSTNKGGAWTTIANLGVADVIDELAVAPSDGQVLYTSVKNRIWKTANGGTNWTEITGTLPNLVIKGIAIDYNNPDHVVVCHAGYSDGDKVFETSNGGSSWANISTGLPNLTTHDVVFENVAEDGLYVGTDVGVYYRDNVTSSWSLYGIGLPNCTVTDLEIQHNTGYLYVATWGRGVWKVLLNNFVPQAPVANLTSNITNVEEGGAVNFSDASSGAPTSWSWSFPGGTPSTSTIQNPSVSYATAGTYSVTLTATNAQGSDIVTKTNYITVFPPNDLKAHYKFDGGLTDASVYGVDLTDSGSTSYPGTYEADHNGNVSSAVITGGASSYLSNTQNFPISGNTDRTVMAWVKSSTLAYQGIVCLGETTPNYHKFSVIINGAGLLRTEVAGTGLSGATTVADGTWHHVAVTYGYDSGSGNGTIKLYVDGVEDAMASNTTWGGISTDPSSVVVGNEKFSVGSRGFVGTLDDVRIYSKVLTAQEVSAVMNENSGTLPTADFTSNVTSVTEGGTVNFTDSSTNTPTSWSWTFAGGTPGTSTAQNPSVVYNTSGTYDVTLTATNAAGNDVITKTGYITVTVPAPVANFTSDVTTVTEGGTVNFTDNSTNTPTSWSWTFAGGTPGTSTAQNPSVVYNTSGTYDVTLTATNAAGNDVITKMGYITVTVPAPVANFTSDVTTVTEGGTVNFTDSSTNTPTSWSWTFSGGTPSTSTVQNPSVVYNTAGTYDVALTATNAEGSDVMTKVGFITVTTSASGTLQAHYLFDGNFTDSSPYARDGVNSGVTFVTDATKGSVADFDGTDRVSIPQYSGVLGVGDRSITGWIKTTTTNKAIMSWGAAATSTKWVFMQNTSGLLRVEIGGGYIVGSTNVADGQWHHVACTFADDGTPNIQDARLYVDGQLEVNSLVGAVAVNTTDGGDVKIGDDQNLRKFIGQMSDIRLYSEALTAQDIANMVPAPTCSNVISDDFEGGFGNWNDGGQNASLDSGNANSGIYSIRLKGGNSSSNMYSNNLDLSSYSTVSFSLSFVSDKVDNGESVVLEMSTNGGGTYSNVKTWIEGTDFNDGVRLNDAFDITNTFSATTVFRLRSTFSQSNESVYIDDVLIQDCSGSSAKSGGNKTSIVAIGQDNNDMQTTKIKLYPNPVSDRLIISLQGATDLNSDVLVVVYTLSGKQIKVDKVLNANDKIELDTSRFARGIYMVAVNVSGTMKYFKVVKQ